MLTGGWHTLRMMGLLRGIFDAPLSGPLSRSQVDTSASAIAAVGTLQSCGTVARVLHVERHIWTARFELSTR